MRQELEAHGLPPILLHVHSHVGPVRSITQMVDCLEDIAIAIGDISILPVKLNAVISAVLVVEAQCASAARDSELLIERAVSQWLVTILLAIGVLVLRVAACECGMSSAVHKVSSDYRIVGVAVNDPRRESAGLEPTVLNGSTNTRGGCRRRSRGRGRASCCRRCWCWSRCSSG